MGYEKLKRTNQGNEFLKNTMPYFKHIATALDIDIKVSSSATSLGPKHLDSVRRNLKKEVMNMSLFYYLSKPKKLLNAYR